MQRARLVERGRDLHHQRHVLLAGAVVVVREVFGAGDLAFAQRVAAADVDVRPVERAVAALGADVEDRAVVVEDREPPQLGGGGRGRVRGRRCRGRAEAGLAEPGGQEVVAAAVVSASWRSRRAGTRVAHSNRTPGSRCSSSRRAPSSDGGRHEPSRRARDDCGGAPVRASVTGPAFIGVVLRVAACARCARALRRDAIILIVQAKQAAFLPGPECSLIMSHSGANERQPGDAVAFAYQFRRASVGGGA